jgi:hypothetical protein
MPGLRSETRGLALAKTVAKFAAAWAALITLFSNDVRFNYVARWGSDAIYNVLSGFPSAARHADLVYQVLIDVLGWTFAVTLFFGTALAVLGAAVRMIARARVRARLADFLDGTRAWTANHRSATRVLLWAPAATWLLYLAWPGPFELHHLAEYLRGLARAAVPDALAGWSVFAITKKGLRELLAPTLDELGAPTRFEVSANEITFRAVAVTRETLAMVTAFTFVTLAVPAFIWTRPILDLFTHESILYFVAGYLAFAALGACAFRRASRIAVGVDGVHVHGTSRARFFAYRDIEAARPNGGDIELVRRGRVVLRLQLHGEDASRRDAVLARIRGNVDRVLEGRGAVAAQLVASSSNQQLARVAGGAGDYRIPTMTREQLWALVEGPEVEASARKAAAEALVRASDGVERARMRVAAERCAEPQVRVALQEIAQAEWIDEGAPRTTLPLSQKGP